MHAEGHLEGGSCQGSHLVRIAQDHMPMGSLVRAQLVCFNQLPLPLLNFPPPNLATTLLEQAASSATVLPLTQPWDWQCLGSSRLLGLPS
jgi:hypothetical protein